MTNTAMTSKANEAQVSFVTVFLNGYFAFQDGRRQRRAMAQQSALTDHALKDIGLDRFEISPVASAAHSNRRHRHAPV